MSIIIPTMRGVLSRLGYRAAVMADNPIAYWRLGEASGTTAVDEKGLYNGTYVGSPTLGVAGVVAGNTAVTFNGSSQYVINTSFASIGYPITLECWAKTTSSSSPTIVSLSLSDTQYHIIGLDTGKPRAGSRNGANQYNALSSTAIGDGNWHYLVAVFENQNSRILYVNGSNVASDSTVVTNFNGNRFGAGALTRPSILGFFPGTIDEVAVYNKALSAERILAHYNARISP